jgi:hypothetical protein
VVQVVATFYENLGLLTNKSSGLSVLVDGFERFEETGVQRLFGFCSVRLVHFGTVTPICAIIGLILN